MSDRYTPFAKTIVLCLALVLASCSQNVEQIYQLSGPIMGTTYSIKLVSSSSIEVEQIKAPIIEAMTQVDKLMSTYKPSSDISKFNNSGLDQWFSVDPLTIEVVLRATEFSVQSEGAFDITVGPLVRLWGFGPDKKPLDIPSQELVEKTKQKVGFNSLAIDKSQSRLKKTNDIYVDLSAIAKGFAVDQVAQVLAGQGFENYLVEIGGEVRASGQKPANEPWVLAIESPVTESRQIWKKISIGNNALATSGDYRNFYEEEGVRYSHTIDPVTGYPAQHKLTSVTVLDASSANADALATMFMVMGEERGFSFAEKEQIPAYFIYRSKDGFAVKYTKQFDQYLVN